MERCYCPCNHGGAGTVKLTDRTAVACGKCLDLHSETQAEARGIPDTVTKIERNARRSSFPSHVFGSGK